MKKPKRPRDTNQLAKFIVDVATGKAQVQDPHAGKDPASLGRRGGLKGGKVRAERLAPEQRQNIASKAAQARWGKSKSG